MNIEAGILIAAVAATPGLLVALLNRRKLDADASAVATQTALSLIQPLRTEVAALKEEVGRLQSQVARFRRGIRLLCGQVRRLGEEPVWELDEDDGDR
jgi:hypothetical protein